MIGLWVIITSTVVYRTSLVLKGRRWSPVDSSAVLADTSWRMPARRRCTGWTWMTSSDEVGRTEVHLGGTGCGAPLTPVLCFHDARGCRSGGKVVDERCLSWRCGFVVVELASRASRTPVALVTTPSHLPTRSDAPRSTCNRTLLCTCFLSFNNRGNIV